MAPLDWSWGESYASPTLISNPQPAPFFNNHAAMPVMHSSHQPPAFPLSSSPTATEVPFQHDAQSQLQAPQSAAPKAGRKRSRDEMSAGDDTSSSSTNTPFPSARPTPSPPKQEPVLGPGMTLIYPDAPMAGASLDAGSQTGTWAEELSERLRTSSVREKERERETRPVLESRKSVRLDKDASGFDDITAAAIAAAESKTDVDFRTSSIEDPTIDAATVTLGIGWTTIPSNPTMDAASRGWARHIETFFPLQSVKIVWKNSSIPAYLVSAVTCDGRTRAGSPSPFMRTTPDPSSSTPSSSSWNAGADRLGSPGYFLFDEKLTRGRLIARSWERTITNLRSNPMAFDTEEIMEAQEDKSPSLLSPSSMTPAPEKLIIDAQLWAGWGTKVGGPPERIASPSHAYSPGSNPLPPPVIMDAPMEVVDHSIPVSVEEGMDIDM